MGGLPGGKDGLALLDLACLSSHSSAPRSRDLRPRQSRSQPSRRACLCVLYIPTTYHLPPTTPTISRRQPQNPLPRPLNHASSPYLPTYHTPSHSQKKNPKTDLRLSVCMHLRGADWQFVVSMSKANARARRGSEGGDRAANAGLGDSIRLPRICRYRGTYVAIIWWLLREGARGDWC